MGHINVNHRIFAGTCAPTVEYKSFCLGVGCASCIAFCSRLPSLCVGGFFPLFSSPSLVPLFPLVVSAGGSLSPVFLLVLLRLLLLMFLVGVSFLCSSDWVVSQLFCSLPLVCLCGPRASEQPRCRFAFSGGPLPFSSGSSKAKPQRQLHPCGRGNSAISDA